jgi:SAM-dependent methyltransferase
VQATWGGLAIVRHSGKAVATVPGVQHARHPIPNEQHQIERRGSDTDGELHRPADIRIRRRPKHLGECTVRRVQTAATCPACGGILRDWRTVPSAEPAHGPAEFLLRRCDVCRSAVSVGHSLVDLHDSGAYSAQQPRLYRLALPLLRTFDQQRMRLLARAVPPPARLLDVGAGRGRFALAAQRAGYDALGIEPSSRGVHAAGAIGAPVMRATIEAAEIEPSSIDVVSLWHVLEHLDDPGGAVQHIAGWLRPRGWLLVGVPNLASVQAQIGAQRWYHLDVPRHRVHFTPAGLAALLDARGFAVSATHHLLLEHNPFGMWQSAVNCLTEHPSYLYNLLKRNAPLSPGDMAITLAAIPLAPVAVVAEAIAAIAHRGGTIAVLARRRT